MAQRQAPQQLGVVQRQVAARPTGQFQAPQVRLLDNPMGDTFAKGLLAFADAGMGALKAHHDADVDAQAAVADIGLDGYQRSMKAALDSQPELYDDPDALAKLDEDMRGKYFSGVTDERILTAADRRIKGFLQVSGETFQYAKAEQQRFELGARTMQLSVDKLEAAYKAGSVTEEDAAAQLKTVFKSLGDSPSMRVSKENREKLIQALQTTYAKDGSRRVLLAKTFMDDEDVGIETRLSLEADYHEGLKATEAEKQEAKFKLYQDWEPLITGGKFTWATAEPAIKAGLVSADDVRSGMRRQETLLQKRIKDAKETTALLGMDPRNMDAKQWGKWEPMLRASVSKEQYYATLHQVGGVAPVVKAQAQRAFTTASNKVESEDQIPSAFKQYMEGDASYLYGAGLLSQHIPPEQLEDTAAYMYMTQSLGKSKVEAYNLLVDGAFSKYSDVDKITLSKLKNDLRSGLDIPKDGSTDVIDATASLAMKLSKTGMDPAEAKDVAVGWTKQAFIETDYGAIPRARVGSYVGEDSLKKRLDFTAKQLIEQEKAAGYTTRTKDLQVNLLDDGRFYFSRRGGNSVVGATSFRLMTDSAPELPDGTPTVEGERQDQIINEQLRTKSAPEYRNSGPRRTGNSQ